MQIVLNQMAAPWENRGMDMALTTIYLLVVSNLTRWAVHVASQLPRPSQETSITNVFLTIQSPNQMGMWLQLKQELPLPTGEDLGDRWEGRTNHALTCWWRLCCSWTPGSPGSHSHQYCLPLASGRSAEKGWEGDVQACFRELLQKWWGRSWDDHGKRLTTSFPQQKGRQGCFTRVSPKRYLGAKYFLDRYTNR